MKIQQTSINHTRFVLGMPCMCVCVCVYVDVCMPVTLLLAYPVSSTPSIPKKGQKVEKLKEYSVCFISIAALNM